jgi:hypothetical protein
VSNYLVNLTKKLSFKFYRHIDLKKVVFLIYKHIDMKVVIFLINIILILAKIN